MDNILPANGRALSFKKFVSFEKTLAYYSRMINVDGSYITFRTNEECDAMKQYHGYGIEDNSIQDGYHGF